MREEPDRGDPEAIDLDQHNRTRDDTALPDWYVPDASYRPIPIAWFAGAFLIQMVVLFVIFLTLIGQHPLFTIAGALLATAMIGKWTWDRGMAEASTAWKSATAVVLAIQLALVCLGAFGRM